MKDKEWKQTERFSIIVKGRDYFLSLDDESKQRYKVKIHNIQECNLHQVKKKELSGDIRKFAPEQWYNSYYS